MKQPVSAALYMRLSRDDETYGDSVSIETQRKILCQYVQDNGIPVYDEYIDDGVSGMTFDRKGFKRMMEDVEAGKVNCIIVKDLSRFGREYIQTGYYLELDFPARGIRFIAVNDNEDTDRGLSEFLPFKSVVNDFYARDTSRKVKAAHRAKFQAGEHFCSYAPLGYKKDPICTNHLVIDDKTRWIVEKIFGLALQGAGAAKISHILFDEQIPTPAYLNYQKNGTFRRCFEDASDSKRYEWDIASVKKLLTDETYIGNTVHYRQTKLSYKSKKVINRAKDDWMIVPDTHDAIISRADFDRVQQMIVQRRRPRKDGTVQIFAGLLKCADCGRSMAYNVNKRATKSYGYYRCSKYSQGMQQCSIHYVRYDVLYAYVLSRLQYWIATINRSEDAFIKYLTQATDDKRDKQEQREASELQALQKRMQKLDTLLSRAYEDRVSDTITERNFVMLTQKYQQEQSELTAKIEALTAQLETAKRRAENAVNWVELVRQYTTPTELTAELLNALIEKITVHEAVTAEDGSKEQVIEIYYRFIGKLD